MTKKIYWRRPYKQLQEGVENRAIVGYDKYPERQESIRNQDTGLFEIKAITYRHTLILDLWLAVIRFDWTSHVK